MTKFLTWNENGAMVLYGIGKYSGDSYEIFFKNNYAVSLYDDKLKHYLKKEIYVS